MMKNNILSFTDHMDRKKAKIKEKALFEISSDEMAKNYETFINDHFKHLTFLQQYIVEEFFYEVMVEIFVLGTEASRPLNMGKRRESLVEAYREDIRSFIEKTSDKHRLFQYIHGMESESIFLIVETLAEHWFSKGLKYGEKQRKMRLI